MKRRDFLALASLAGAAGVSLPVPYAFAAAQGETSATGAMGAVGAAARAARYSNLLILVELKGGNDGLNTVIPYANPLYRTLRPAIGVKREQVVQLDERAALHPALEPLMPIWRDGRLAIVEGVGYPQPNLSHFRSIEIWDTASRANEYGGSRARSRRRACRPASPRTASCSAARKWGRSRTARVRSPS